MQPNSALAALKYGLNIKSQPFHSLITKDNEV